MEYIRKLPFIAGAFMSLLVGIISLKFENSRQDIYVRMIVALLVFYILGLYARNAILKIQDEIDEKKRLEEVRIKEELEKQKLLEMEEMKNNHASTHKNNKDTGQNIDVKVDDNDFSPLTVSEVIVNKLNE